MLVGSYVAFSMGYWPFPLDLFDFPIGPWKCPLNICRDRWIFCHVCWIFAFIMDLGLDHSVLALSVGSLHFPLDLDLDRWILP